MYPYLKTNVVLVEGKKAYGIYDLEKGTFDRVSIDAGKLLKSVDGTKKLDDYDINEISFIKLAGDKGYINFQKEHLEVIQTELSNVLIDTRKEIKFAWIEITGTCNQKCLHCFMGSDLNRYGNIPKEQIYKHIDTLYDKGVSQIIITGGEPTLHPEFEEIIDYAARYDFTIGIITNGTSQCLIDLIPKLKAYGIKIKISILGWEDTHDIMVGKKGNFEIVKSNIERLAAEKVAIELEYTVCAININDIEKVKDFAKTLKIKLDISPMYPVGKAKDNYNLLYGNYVQRDFIRACQINKNLDYQHYEPAKAYRFIKQTNITDYEAVSLKDCLTNCRECGQKIIAILCSGKVTPCLLLRDNAYLIGEIQKESLEKILDYNNSNRAEFNKKIKLDNIEDCQHCEAIYICKGGGCMAITNATYGNINKKNPYFSFCYYKGSD